MIYDDQDNKLSDTCFRSNDQFPLIWAPNSQHLAIPGYIGDGGALIDVQKNKLYNLTVIPDIIYPQEWMNSIP